MSSDAKIFKENIINILTSQINKYNDDIKLCVTRINECTNCNYKEIFADTEETIHIEYDPYYNKCSCLYYYKDRIPSLKRNIIKYNLYIDNIPDDFRMPKYCTNGENVIELLTDQFK